MTFTSHGFLQSDKITVTNVVMKNWGKLNGEDHANYMMVVTSRLAPFKFITITQFAPVIIWEDHQKVDVGVCVWRGMLDYGNGDAHVTHEKHWPSFDERYLKKAKDSVKRKPLYELIPPVKGPELLLPLQTISERN